jgi:hypothetical protein
MSTTTCRKCGKIDLPIQKENDRTYSFCTICFIRTKNPIPDDFENQSKLTTFFPILEKPKKSIKMVPPVKKFKQTILPKIHK